MFKSLAFNLSSAISLSAFALLTNKPLSILSALALWSATLAAALPSFMFWSTKPPSAFVAPFIFPDMSSIPKVTFATAFPATLPASENSPLKSKVIALPSCGISSTIPSNLLTMFSFISFAKLLIAFFGFSKAEITSSPKSANRSTRFPVTAPITPIILANLFCPSSEP